MEPQTAKGVTGGNIQIAPDGESLILSLSTDDGSTQYFGFSLAGLTGVVRRMLAALAEFSGRSGELYTFTVTSSQTVTRPDGTAGLKLLTDAGPMVFQIDKRAIDALRKQLTTAETFLRQPTGRA